jgi:hypothetical protein
MGMIMLYKVIKKHITCSTPEIVEQNAIRDPKGWVCSQFSELFILNDQQVEIQAGYYKYDRHECCCLVGERHEMIAERFDQVYR